MAYTRPWTNNSPLGTRSAAEIDDAIREARVDVAERMDDITAVGGKWTVNDPITLPASANSILSAKRFDYDDALAAGTKTLNEEDLQSLLAYRVNHLTNGVSQFTVNFGAISEKYDLNDISFLTPVRGILRDLTVSDFAFMLLASFNAVAETALYHCLQADGGPLDFDQIDGIQLYFFSAKPLAR